MTLQVSNAGAEVQNSELLQGSPAVRITGTDVRFVNAANGKLVGTAWGKAALEIAASGVEVVNQAGGQIRHTEFYSAIQGSAFADTVINRGTIGGRVYMGAGNDRFVQAGAGQVDVFFEDGDDLFEIASAADVQQHASGGSGHDTVIITSASSHVRMAVSSFEQLDVTGLDGYQTRNVSNAYGFKVINLEAGGGYNFIDGANPDADINLVGGSFTAAGRASFRSILGSAQAEYVAISDTAFYGDAAFSSVDLGGGDDSFTFNWTYDSYYKSAAATRPTIAGIVNGGSGTDRLDIVIGGGRTMDLTQFLGFERLDLGRSSSFISDMRLLNADGFLTITADHYGVLSLASSYSPRANLDLPSQTTVTIEADSVLGSARPRPGRFRRGVGHGGCPTYQSGNDPRKCDAQ